MKKIITAAIVGTTMLATPAFAQQVSDNASFEVTATVPGTCTIGTPGAIALNTLDVNTTAGADALTLTKSSVQRSSKFWISCNDTNKMTVTSANKGFLVSDGAAPTTEEAAEGFTNQIAYNIGAEGYLKNDWQYQPTLNEGSNNNYQGKERGPIHREINMRAAIGTEKKNAGKRPLEGTYRDNVTITVQIAA
jgi:spore coat protein U-like protein